MTTPATLATLDFSTVGQCVATDTSGIRTVHLLPEAALDTVMSAIRAIPVATDGAALLASIGALLDAKLSALATIPAAPTTAGWLSTLTLADGATVVLPVGTETAPVHVGVAQTIKGAGMRATILDGQGGVGAGHRLAWGKGVIHAGAPVTIQDIGFVNGGGGDGNSDGEAGFYAEGFAGTATLLRCAFDRCENGVFLPGVALANANLVVDGCVFGRNGPNGIADGRSHDLYVSGKSVTIRNSVFAGNSLGNIVKCRGPLLALANNHIRRGTNGNAGRFVDAPGGTVVTSTGNTYVDVPGSPGGNIFGFYDEGDATANPDNPGSFTSDGDTFYLSRSMLTLWINNPATVVQFRNAKVFWVGAAGATPPVVTIQGPGALTGANPFLFTAANRVDTVPALPGDPTA